MDLTLFTYGNVSCHPTEELKVLHKDKMLSSEVSDSVRITNLRHFLSIYREYSAQLSLESIELFSGMIFEGYCTTSQNLYSVLSVEIKEEEFTQIQMTLPFILRNDYSNLVTYLSAEESKKIRDTLTKFCIDQLINPDLSRNNKFNIADVLLTSGNNKLFKIAEKFIEDSRDSKSSYGQFDTDDQNVHSKTINMITVRKLKVIAKDEIPKKGEFYNSIFPEIQNYKEKKEEKTEESSNNLLIVSSNARVRWLGYTDSKGVPLSKEAIAALPTVKVAIYFGVKDMPINPKDMPDIPSVDNDSVIDRVKIALGLSSDPKSLQRYSDVALALQTYFETMIINFSTHKLKIKKALERIQNDSVIYENMTLSDIFQRVLNRVFKMYKQEYFPELINRVYEELTESEGFCASGYVARLLNILSGYPEIDIQISEPQVEDISIDLRTIIENEISTYSPSSKDELENGMISITKEERKPFVNFCKSRIVKWYNKIVDEYKANASKGGYNEFFEEEFKQAVYKICGIQISIKKGDPSVNILVEDTPEEKETKNCIIM